MAAIPRCCSRRSHRSRTAGGPRGRAAGHPASPRAGRRGSPPGAGFVIRKSSLRVSSRRTARRRTSVAAATSGSIRSALPPNPPPIVAPVTRTADLRETEQPGQLRAGIERPLRGRRDVQRSVLVELGHRHLRFEVALVDPARREPTLDHDVARGERGRDVATPEPGALDHVVGDRLVRRELLGSAADRRVLRFGRRSGVHVGPVEAGPRRARLDGTVEIGDRLERASSRP